MTSLADDERRLAEYAAELATALADALAPWVVAAVGRRADGVAVEAAAAGERCRVELAPAIASLLASDIDAQRTTPLAMARGAARYATEVLAAAGVAPVPRDEFARRVEPGDVYDLAPATWADFGERVAEAGLVWGAAKAHVHLRRHGRR